MPETYSKAEVEAALTNVGFTIGSRVGALSLYQTNFSPGHDLVLSTGQEAHWNGGTY